MITFRNSLYIGDNIKKPKNKIIKQIKSGKYPPGLYLLTRAQSEYDQLEILSCALMKQEAYRTLDIHVIGIASGYTDALGLLKRIANDVYRKHMDVDIRSFAKKE